MTTSAWLHSVGIADADSSPPVAESLARRGIELGRLNTDAPAPLGLLFLGLVTPAHCQLIREWSNDGLNRVLVVARDRSVVAGGGAWQLLHAGASDVLVYDDLPDPPEAIAARLERWRAIDDLLVSPVVREELVGRSRAWTALLRQVIEVARFTAAPVLLLGETGTGKEQIARLIHTLDQRPEKGDLVVLDCTTIVPELAGSEFFGHERGAFTSAVASRDGAFALADGGTLFLDEVGELAPPLQAQLLRVVQEQTYKRVGSNTWRHTDFRLVCATNRDLLTEESQGTFRRDLFYRIAGWVCRLPPLRERTEDIIPLVQHFMRRIRPDRPPPELHPAVREYLLLRDYPGNVRDLKQLATRMMYRHVGPGPITVGDIPEEERPRSGIGPAAWPDTSFEQAIRRALVLGAGIRDIRRIAEDTAVRIATLDEGGNLQRAAQRLGVTDRALQLRRAARRPADDGPDGDGVFAS